MGLGTHPLLSSLKGKEGREERREEARREEEGREEGRELYTRKIASDSQVRKSK